MNPFDRFSQPAGMRGDEFDDGDDDEREYEAEEDERFEKDDE